MDDEVITVADEVSLWLADGGSIHLKTLDRHGEPAELTAEAARGLAAVLVRLADRL